MHSTVLLAHVRDRNATSELLLTSGVPREEGLRRRTSADVNIIR